MANYCLVSFCNLYILPYAKTYIDEIRQTGNDCSLLYWDRDAVGGENDHYEDCQKYIYQQKLSPESTGIAKLIGYIKAAHYFNKILKNQKFDGIIFLQTHAAVMCQSILKQRYINKYIVDIRDYTWENNAFYYKIEKKVLNDAFAVVISSPAYKTFLPDMDYVVAHNYTPFPQETVISIRNSKNYKSSGPISISFVGTIRFIEMDKKILSIFKNDDRFKVNYFGTGSEVLEKYARDNGIKNTEFHGSFSSSETTDFYMKTDLINNLYGNHDNFLDYALSNKLYHSAQFHIPILVCPDTYMEEITNKYNMGFVFDVDDNNSPNKLYKWFNEFNRVQLADGCEHFLNTVKDDNARFLQMINRFIRK